MTSDAFDFTAYDSVRIQFAYYHRNFNTGEDFFIKLRENGSFNTVASFSKPTDFNANGFYSVNVLMDANDFAFATNSKLRIQSDASRNNDQIFIDQVILTGYTSASSSNLQMNDEKTKSLFFIEQAVVSRSADQAQKTEFVKVADMILYPNPTEGNIYLQNIDIEKIKNVQVFELNGRLVTTQKLNSNEISLLNCSSGLYIAKINLNNGDSLMKKFWKK